MHLYHANPKLLEKWLNSFVGGQFQMKTGSAVFRGAIKDCMALSDKRIKITFSWLCERRLFFDTSEILKPKWFLLTAPPGLHHLDVEWRYFYFQADEDRIKMKGLLGEVCHFFQKEDHTNLVCCGDEFVSHCNLHQLDFRRIVTAILLK